MNRIYTAGGINWTWYIDANLNEDGTATIHRFWRLHNSDPNQGAFDHPEDMRIAGSAELLEDKQRNVHSLAVRGGLTYKVRNPKHVFDYD